jgi:toxin ParE1/3/4
VPRIVLSPRADEQIIDVLAFTLARFGEVKYLDYLGLIGTALETLEARPTAGKQRPEIHPDAWTFHIARRGRRARHLFLYRIRAEVEIARFLYDSMDLRRQRPPEWSRR